jgi:UDP-N-acetylglucosamine--N-acetylmuramyl-(pentapeptide) pyrophosphoryl-undecaprenol N-acetylglucosamine transferase
MRAPGEAPLILLAAGGTGGHLFPAEALAAALRRRGMRIALATDVRAARYGERFPADSMHVIPSETIRGRNPVALAQTAALLGLGLVKAWRLVGRLQPAAAVGFGGYPTLPPLAAAILRRIPTVIHDGNAVMGRANRLLAPCVTAIATGFGGILDHDPRLAGKARHTGTPLRPAVTTAAEIPYAVPEPGGPFRLLIFGGSQGARVMAEIVPAAIAQIDAVLRARLEIVHQARPEDLAPVTEAYARLAVRAEVKPFFADLPARMAAAHLVIARSGAGTVAELAAIGRPAILVPLPHALDQDQLANARVLERAGAAILLTQDVFTAERLAAELAALAADPTRLATMAAAAKGAGTIDAAERLADLVINAAGLAEKVA